jgi:hypothetical protein
MSKRKYVNALIFVYLLNTFTGNLLLHAQDSVSVKLPKHYFNTLIAIDGYRKPQQDLDTLRPLSRKLQTYGIKQLTINFHAPLATKNWVDANGVTKNTHLLITGTYMNFRPQFSGIKDHTLVKLGVGMRYIYNTGKKGVWFADVSPFVTRDATGHNRGFYRMASTLLYSHNVSEKFNWRLGVTKSFLWGNRFYLPFVGLRIGSLEKINLSIQFPRSISLVIPAGSKLLFSFYSRPQGGLFYFSNSDSLYPKRTEKNFHLSRYELNTGVRADLRPGKRLALYISAGLSSRNNLTFFSEGANRKNSFYNTYFYSKNLPATFFLNAGLVLRLGRTRSYYGNKNINDAIDIGNTVDGNMGANGISTTPRKNERLNLQSVQDLVDYNDY